MGHKMGFQGVFKYGVKGATAGTTITNIRDKKYDLDPKKGDTTEAGDGTNVPLETEQVCALGISIEWTMIEKDNDSTLAALKAAAFTGQAVALRTLDYAAGKGFDGDVTLKASEGKPLRGEGTWVFTATPTAELRAPQLYV